MNWHAKWIWGSGEASPRNEWRCFRKVFVVPKEGWDSCKLFITADSRYILYVNGTQIGRGPMRSWPFEQSYDEYEIGYLLSPGKANVISVLVMHFGVSTFYYLRGRGGLLLQMEAQKCGQTVFNLVSNSAWKTSIHRGYDSRSPRMACQQAFSERVDARLWDEEWLSVVYNDSTWENAEAIGEVGIKPWDQLVLRDIPPLTEEVIYPSKVESLHKVKPYAWSSVIDIRNQMVPGSEDHANPVKYCGYIGTMIRMIQKGRLVLTFPNSMHVFGACSVDGVIYKPEDFSGLWPQKEIALDLDLGDHLFLMDVSSMEHGRGFHIALDCDCDFEVISPMEGEKETSPFFTIGPFDSFVCIDYEPDRDLIFDREAFTRILGIGVPSELALLGSHVRGVPLRLVSRDDVHALCTIPRESTALSVPAYMQHVVIANASFADIPIFEKRDTQFTIDFGKEVAGYISFDLEAEEGTIIDFYGFEFQHGGRIQHTIDLDNTLRYTCTKGRQYYTSPVYRGFRYLAVIVRGSKHNIRVHHVKVIQSTYPVAEIGKFQCSNALLNEIWKISQYTTRLCMEDTFVDCPAYEQTYWVGDSRNEALISYYTFGAYDLVKRCLRLVPGSVFKTPLYYNQVPSGWSSVIPNWTFFWVIACYEYYYQTEDLNFIQQIWPTIRQTLDSYLDHINTQGLLYIRGWNLLDWAPIDQPNDGVVTHQNLFLVKALLAAAELAEVADNASIADFYRVKAQDIKETINLYLWSEEKNAYVDCIHVNGKTSETFSMQTQLVAYLCSVAEGERASCIERYLCDYPEGFVKIGSPFMSFFYYEALINAGRFEEMMDDMIRSFGSMIHYGATTCWETYPGTNVDSMEVLFPTRSHCHAWSAAPAYFLGAYVLGVRGTSPGWKNILVSPHTCGLSWAKGSVPLAGGGKMEVDWRVVESETRFMHVKVKAPDNVELTVQLPEGYTGKIEIERVLHVCGL